MNKIGFILILSILLMSCIEPQKVQYIEPRCLSGQTQCYFDSEFGQFSILFNVERALAERPFNVIVQLDTPQNINISGHIEGRDMYMGKIPLIFDSKKEMSYKAKVQFGSCGREKMIWRMWFILKNDNGDMKRFYTDFPSYLT